MTTAATAKIIKLVGSANPPSLVALYGGSLGEMHGLKICKILDMALKTGRPVICLMILEVPEFRKEWHP